MPHLKTWVEKGSCANSTEDMQRLRKENDNYYVNLQKS